MEGKYGRLYPERAVASLRNRAENERDALSRGGNLAGASLWTDVLNLLESEGFPPDEPLFLLRGQDDLAPEAVEFYAATVQERGAPLNVERILGIARTMQAWQPRKLPD